MSLVIPCRKIDPSPEGLEEICINLVTEAEITDAGQRDIEQYIKQIKEKLIERGVEWMPLYENEEVD